MRHKKERFEKARRLGSQYLSLVFESVLNYGVIYRRWGFLFFTMNTQLISFRIRVHVIKFEHFL